MVVNWIMGVIGYGVIHRRKSDLPYFAVTDVRRILMSTNFLAFSVLFTSNFGPAFRDSRGFVMHPKDFFASCPECAKKQNNRS